MQKLTFLMKLAFHEPEAFISSIKKQKQIAKVEELKKRFVNDLLSCKVRVKA